jgi:hypothetical protein
MANCVRTLSASHTAGRSGGKSQQTVLKLTLQCGPFTADLRRGAFWPAFRCRKQGDVCSTDGQQSILVGLQGHGP